MLLLDTKVIEQLMAWNGMDMKMAKTCYHSHLIPQISFRCYICQNEGVTLVIKGAEIVSKKAYVGEKRKKGKVEAKKETVKKKEGKKDKDEGVLMVVEKGKEVVLNKKVKCDPVNILTRMSPSHLKNFLDNLTTQQVSVLEELGLGEYHNNFNFPSTPGALRM
ncbi:hypothetical protein Tco_1524990 [Tanacetum coccineum]